jgi:hypothetical protein
MPPQLKINLDLTDPTQKIIIQKAYVIKCGFINLKLKEDDLLELMSDENEKSVELFKSCESNILSTISKSNLIFDITYKAFDDNETTGPSRSFIYGGGNFFGNYWKLNFKIPKRKRTDINKVGWGNHKPDEFSCLFNGCLFFAYSEINSIPESTDIGQVSREILESCFSESELFDLSYIFPTPMHPEIYLLCVDNKDKKAFNKLVFTIRDDLYIIGPSGIPIDDLIKEIISRFDYRLFDFYNCKQHYIMVQEKVNEFNILNKELGEQLSNYFSTNTIIRMLSGKSSNIRKSLSKMHLKLNEITSGKISNDAKVKEFIKNLNDNEILREMECYFRDQVDQQPIDFDLDSQITTMNFASSETSDLSMVKATILASLVGAIIGGLISSAILFLTK